MQDHWMRRRVSCGHWYGSFFNKWWTAGPQNACNLDKRVKYLNMRTGSRWSSSLLSLCAYFGEIAFIACQYGHAVHL